MTKSIKITDYIVKIGSEQFNFGPCDELTRRYIKTFFKEGLISTFKKTSDDWFQPFPNNYVAVIVVSRKGKLHEKDIHGVYVTGFDDMCMECIVIGRGEARQLFNRLPDVLTFQNLSDLGFHDVS